MRSEFNILEVFNYVDGRLATPMDAVYEIANAYTKSKGVTTIGLLFVYDKIKKDRPDWFVKAEEHINVAKDKVGNDFEVLTDFLSKNYSYLKFTIQ